MKFRVIKAFSHGNLGMLEPGLEVELTQSQAQYPIQLGLIVLLDGQTDENPTPSPTNPVSLPLTKILFGDNAPTPTLGVTGDLYIQRNGSLFQKQASIGWVEQLNLALVNQARQLGFFHVVDEPPSLEIGADGDVAFVIQAQAFYKRVQGNWFHAADITVETKPIIGFGTTPSGGYQVFISQEGSLFENQNGSWVLRYSIPTFHTGSGPVSSLGKPGDLYFGTNKTVHKKDLLGWQNIVTLSDPSTSTPNGQNLLYNSTFMGGGTKTLLNGTQIAAVGNTYGTGTFSIPGPLENQPTKGSYSMLAQSGGFNVTVGNQPTEIKAFLTSLGYSSSFAWKRPGFAIARFTPLQTATWFARVARYAGWASVYDVTVGGYIRVNPLNGGPVYFDDTAIPTTLLDNTWHWIWQLRSTAAKTGAFTYPSGSPGCIIDLAWPAVLLGDWRTSPPPIEPILNSEEL